MGILSLSPLSLSLILKLIKIIMEEAHRLESKHLPLGVSVFEKAWFHLKGRVEGEKQTT